MEKLKIYWLAIAGGILIGLLFAIGKAFFSEEEIDGILMLAIIAAGSVVSFVLLRKYKK